MNAKAKPLTAVETVSTAPVVGSSKRPKLVIKTMTLDVLAMANAACVPFSQLLRELQDGRVCSRYTEHWAAQLFGFDKHINSNQKDSDGVFAATDTEAEAFVSVKCLTGNGVKFQNSKDVGAGRSCDKEKLLAAINATQKIMVVDIMKMPKARLILLDSSMVAKWVNDGKLGTSGLRASTLTKLLESEYDELEEVSVDMQEWKLKVEESNKAEAEAFFASLKAKEAKEAKEKK